jgi:hypothetical protein
MDSNTHAKKIFESFDGCFDCAESNLVRDFDESRMILADALLAENRFIFFILFTPFKEVDFRYS